MSSFPEWNDFGVLPPFMQSNTAQFGRSPYIVDLSDFVLRYSTSPARKEILAGYLAFRKLWQDAGITDGFHWIDGSFTENIELVESRSPNDIDLMTFFKLPAGQTQETLFIAQPALFNRGAIKTQLHIDSYWVCLNSEPRSLIHNAAYWNSLWSHRRNATWKGYIQIDLSPMNEDDLLAELQAVPAKEAIDA